MMLHRKNTLTCSKPKTIKSIKTTNPSFEHAQQMMLWKLSEIRCMRSAFTQFCRQPFCKDLVIWIFFLNNPSNLKIVQCWSLHYSVIQSACRSSVCLAWGRLELESRLRKILLLKKVVSQCPTSEHSTVVLISRFQDWMSVKNGCCVSQ